MENLREIPKKNYLFLLLIIVLTVVIVICFYIRYNSHRIENLNQNSVVRYND